MAYAQDGEDGTGSLLDITMEDYRHVIDFFTTHGQDSGMQVLSLAKPPGRLECVAMEVDALRTAGRYFGPVGTEYTQLSVPAHHELFHQTIYSPLSAFLGLPLQVARYPFFGLFNEDDVFSPIRDLMLFRDDQAAKDPRDSLSAVVVREDRKPLAPLHLEALMEFIESKILPMMPEFRRDNPGVKMSMEHLRGKVTPDDFKNFFHNLRAEKAQKDASLLEIPSPFEV
ncbi:hypothetical protein BU16DRAFT_522143 [Lophium mytilinum]|uniref:Uncharacterized protein n=1 Tax=Lophium mytilinum TaxID=390894 RepID=A0A6A6R8R1_9PEZI|nr:hypothetical protein BU16DRAFT_522143 [Lophium mytilinum]